MAKEKSQESSFDRTNLFDRLEAFVEQSQLLAVRIAIFGLFISGAANLLTHEMKVDLIDSYLLRPGNLKTSIVGLLSILVTVVFLIHLFARVLRQRTRPTMALKKRVARAFQSALDHSSFNPTPIEPRNDQLA